MFCHKCGNKIEEGTRFCGKCGEKVSKSDTKTVKISDKNSLEGLGGWLTIVCLGLVVGVVWNVYNLFDELSTYNNTPSLNNYPQLQNSLIFEIVAFFILAAMGVYLIYLFSKRKTLFPKLFVGFLACTVLYSVIDYSLVSSLVNTYPQLHDAFQGAISDANGGFSRSIIAFIIWGLYMRISKRVKLTFIE